MSAQSRRAAGRWRRAPGAPQEQPAPESARRVSRSRNHTSGQRAYETAEALA